MIRSQPVFEATLKAAGATGIGLGDDDVLTSQVALRERRGAGGCMAGADSILHALKQRDFFIRMG